jgi:hypothetical protein
MEKVQKKPQIFAARLQEMLAFLADGVLRTHQ